MKLIIYLSVWKWLRKLEYSTCLSLAAKMESYYSITSAAFVPFGSPFGEIEAEIRNIAIHTAISVSWC